ncbi:MAG: hypothetical protein ACYCVC_05330 [Acidimicrobiales bacterium]
MPVNWYAALVLIVLLGLASIIYSRHEYQSPAAASTTPPVVGTTWYAGYAFDICGKVMPPLASNQSTSSSTQSFYTTGNGVITISPKTAAETGTNATLGKFVAAYPKLTLTNSRLGYPAARGVTHYSSGSTCPKGTPDAGKKARVTVTSWKNFLNSTKGVPVTGNVADLRFSSNQEITIGFVPAGTTLARPPATVVEAMLNAAGASSSTTPTTAPGAPTTTAPGAPTTTAPGAPTTTAPGAPTTTAPGAPTTTAPGAPTTTAPGAPTTTAPTTTSTTGASSKK